MPGTLFLIPVMLLLVVAQQGHFLFMREIMQVLVEAETLIYMLVLVQARLYLPEFWS
jgi:hypothetical protein